jgi:hypothetical protein
MSFCPVSHCCGPVGLVSLRIGELGKEACWKAEEQPPAASAAHWRQRGRRALFEALQSHQVTVELYDRREKSDTEAVRQLREEQGLGLGVGHNTISYCRSRRSLCLSGTGRAVIIGPLLRLGAVVAQTLWPAVVWNETALPPVSARLVELQKTSGVKYEPFGSLAPAVPSSRDGFPRQAAGDAGNEHGRCPNRPQGHESIEPLGIAGDVQYGVPAWHLGRLLVSAAGKGN